MRQLIVSRVTGLVPLLAFTSVVVFSLTRMSPADPAVTLAGDDATPARIAEIRADLGLDQPLLVQYLHWLSEVLQGNLGVSLFNRLPVTEQVLARIPVDLSLLLFAVLAALLIGVPLGIIGAVRRDGWPDLLGGAVTSVLLSVPSFWLGMMLIQICALQLDLFPVGGYRPPSAGFTQWLHHLVLPGLAVSAIAVGDVAKQTRTAMVRILDEDYIRSARAKGLSRASVLYKHGLRNAVVPIATVLSLQLPILVGGTVTIEMIFNLPGIGRLMYTAVTNQDFPVIQGIVLVAVLVVVAGTTIVELVNRALLRVH